MTDDLTPTSGTIVVFSDIWCSFAHVAVHRLHASRRRLGDLVNLPAPQA